MLINGGRRLLGDATVNSLRSRPLSMLFLHVYWGCRVSGLQQLLHFASGELGFSVHAI